MLSVNVMPSFVEGVINTTLRTTRSCGNSTRNGLPCGLLLLLLATTARGLDVQVQVPQAGGVRGDTEPDLTPSIDHLLEEAALPGHVIPEDTDDGSCVTGTHLTELDMCLTREQMQAFQLVVKEAGVRPGQRHKRQSPLLAFPLWPGGLIPYVFNHSFPAADRTLVLSAMAEWERVTCIRFRPATAEDRDLVVFRDGHRCSTNIGRVGGTQLMTLAQPCRRKRILIHELGHLLGLIHEHQRHDRDSYVRVLLHNVRTSSQERYQFAKLAPRPLTDGQVEYSYTSIMHYGRNYFAKSPELTTLQTMDPQFQMTIGRAELPAFSDAETVNVMYGCAGTLQNRLPDATCEFFQRSGQCEGSIQDAIRPLCPKSCQQQPLRHQAHRQSPFPSRPLPGVGGAVTMQHKTYAPQWGQTTNEIGQQGGPPVDSLVSPSPSQQVILQLPRTTLPLKQTAHFGTAPFTIGTPTLQLQQQLQQRRQQLQQQTSVAASLKRHFAIKPSMVTQPHITAPGRQGLNQLPAWMWPRQTSARPQWDTKAAGQKPTTTRLPHTDPGAGDVFLAAHNMKALSPEALPESVAGLAPAVHYHHHHHQQQQHYGALQARDPGPFPHSSDGGGGGFLQSLSRALGVAASYWSGGQGGADAASGWTPGTGGNTDPWKSSSSSTLSEGWGTAASTWTNGHNGQHESPEHPEGTGGRRSSFPTLDPQGPVMHHVLHLGPEPRIGFRML